VTLDLYHSPRGLYGFQSKFVAYGALRRSNLVVADTGLGKTHIALATLALLFEDDKIDRAIVVVEGNKVDEWLDDIATFTSMRAVKLHGTKRVIPPGTQIVVTTYTTFKLDMTDRHPADARSMWPSPLALDQPSRMMIVYDEAALIGTSTTSQQYFAHKLIADHFRANGELRTMALTATPMTTSPLNYYVLGTLLDPELVGPPQDFYPRFVSGFDITGRPSSFHHLDEFRDIIGQLILRKRKTDPDVIEFFPTLVERFTTIKISKAHRAAYDALDEHIRELPPYQQVIGFRALQAFACHPGSIFGTSSEHLAEFIESYGAAKLAKLRSSKSAAVIPYLREILGQEQGGVIVFCNSVRALECLARDLDAEEIAYALMHGQMPMTHRNTAKAAFRDGSIRVLLSSAVGERGINLPEAHYVVNFDVPPQHSAYLQRLSRASRIEARVGGSLTVKTYIAQDTIDHGAIRLWMRRNQWSDTIQDWDAVDDGDPEFISSADRWRLMAQSARMTIRDPGEAA
jgi:SNF2 family DNA or RNA helicase